ncbi:MAG: hypothetical protein AAB400_01765 [Patescibacteria group bacterium]
MQESGEPSISFSKRLSTGVKDWQGAEHTFRISGYPNRIPALDEAKRLLDVVVTIAAEKMAGSDDPERIMWNDIDRCLAGLPDGKQKEFLMALAIKIATVQKNRTEPMGG